jgi:hypothetical protein
MTAVYLYCVIRSVRRPPAARIPDGVPGGGRPEVHSVAPSLWIVAGDVPLDIYGPAQLEARLRDLDWVSQTAMAHEAVVEHCAKSRTATVVPMKLFTMFSRLDKAIQDIASRGDDIRRAMRRIAGAEEWGVRVFRRPLAPDGDRRVTPVSGADFLRARRQARDLAKDARATAGAAAERAFGRLRRLARDARVRESSSAGTNPPMLDAAFLVACSARARFKAEVRRQARALAGAGADLTLTGPWPAYTFVTSGASA